MLKSSYKCPDKVRSDEEIKAIAQGCLDTKMDTLTRPVYRYAPTTTPGFNAEFWDTSNGPHLDPLEWSGPAHPDHGFPAPTANAPNVSIVSNAANITDAGSGLAGARYGWVWGWAVLPDDATHVQEISGNTGELGMVLVGDCCGGPLSELAGGNHDTNTNGADRGVADPSPVSGGLTFFLSPQSDQSVNQGTQIQYSNDGGTTWFPLPDRRPDKPEIECIDVPLCDPVPEGWSEKKPKEVCQPKWLATGEDVPDQAVCLGNFTDFSVRTGWRFPWTAVFTSDAPNTVDDWVRVGGQTMVTPDCPTDIKVDAFLGTTRMQIRRTLGYHQVDWRVLINGLAVYTITSMDYWWNDHREDTNPDVIPPLKSEMQVTASVTYARQSVAPNSVIEVQMRRRYRSVGSQSSAYYRTIGGLNSHAALVSIPTEIVTGRL